MSLAQQISALASRIATEVKNKAPLVHQHAGGDITSGQIAYARLPVGQAANTVAAGDDGRFTNTRTPSPNTVPCDFVYVAASPSTIRSVGTGDWNVGMAVKRPFTLTSALYQFARCGPENASERG